MAPVKVFGSAVFANAARVLACLEEVGAEYEVVEVDYMAEEHKSPSHLARNPFGQIPAFQDGELVLFESRAIAKYVFRKYSMSAQVDLLREGNLEEAAMVDVWTEVEAHHYFPAIAPIVYECVVYPARLGIPPNQKVVDESLEKLKKVLDVYEVHLLKSRFLAGDFFSFADLNHFPYTFYFMATPHASLFDSYPRVKAWWESLMARPSVKKISADMVLTA
ncbi:probable glutathione S-transferase GSTF1 [Phragmites australis]|uniref:probable glutathione S-transferase GSTF1 n=1 Tax=Phragmites australis TaxID=29695 RepID=UPI002D7914A4|nr:probable glutathione S-transferase GSTF1 [Phragmites australis]